MLKQYVFFDELGERFYYKYNSIKILSFLTQRLGVRTLSTVAKNRVPYGDNGEV
jgi:hypothetical protein